MGCAVNPGREDGVPYIEVSGSNTLKSIETDMTLMPDTAQTLAVIAACASGTTRITGLSTLKHKETDRLVAMKTELEKIGIRCHVTDDSIEIDGTPDTSAMAQGEPFDTYDDHRMAMSLAVLACRVDGLKIREPEVVTKSFPNFWDTFAELGIQSR
jgi:3-phosphoshikimate 1-carboxyvinyltransferase